MVALLKILILAIIQGAAELLPVSSSAHVIVAEKLMGLDPVSPEMTLLLVMLHTGTMFAVIVYFWSAWRVSYFRSREVFWRFAKLVIVATAFTGAVGLLLKSFIERVVLHDVPHAEVELLFGNMTLIAVSLFIVGLFIIYAGAGAKGRSSYNLSVLRFKESSLIGAIQGLCLPFRGFSRSGATISMGLTLGIGKVQVEEFSFALAVVLTPPVIVREMLRLLKAHSVSLPQDPSLLALFYPSLVAMVFSFISGILALRWLSRWLDRGLWHIFGYYCLAASVVVFILHSMLGI
jgi:undecaprenyl-diphosphatase